jgi:preprotein translocase subunit SecE
MMRVWRWNVEKQNKKVLSVSFIVMAFIVAVVVDVVMESLAASFGTVARIRSIDLVSYGLPISVGFLTFLFLQFNKKVLLWGDEVVVEIRKVVWPSRRDTTAMTIVTCVMLVISGILLGVFDFVAGNLIKMILN